MTEPAKDARTGAVPSPAPVYGKPPAAAVAALNAVLEVKPSIAQMLRYAELLTQLSDPRAAVFDGACNRVLTYTAFARCIRVGGHTPDNCRWAVPDDLPYDRFPTITDCWAGGTP